MKEKLNHPIKKTIDLKVSDIIHDLEEIIKTDYEVIQKLCKITNSDFHAHFRYYCEQLQLYMVPYEEENNNGERTNDVY